MIKRATLVLLTFFAVSAAACANSKVRDYFADEIIENTTGNSTERKIIVKARYDKPKTLTKRWIITNKFSSWRIYRILQYSQG